MNRLLLATFGFLLISFIFISGGFAEESEDSVPTSQEQGGSEVLVDDENLDGFTGYSKPMGYIKDINILRKRNGTISLVLLVDTPFLAEVKVLNFPFRLLIDIPMPYGWGVDSQSLKSKIPITVVSGFRYGNPVENVFRVVADLGRPVSIDRAYVRAVPDGYEFSIELGSSNTGNSVLAANVIAYTDDPDILKDVAQIAFNREQQIRSNNMITKVDTKIKEHLDNVKYPAPLLPADRRKVLIMLDPGHGGADPGAVSEDGSIQEKDFVLAVAKKIKDALETNDQISVVLTRSGDYYVPLGDRVLWTEFLRADLFVSIHADKSESNKSSSGLSVYTLSDVASDVHAQLLANAANRSDIDANIKLESSDEEVNRILNRLSQRSRVNNSVRLANSIISKAPREVRILSNPVRSAGFHVLKIPTIPSVLVELGFLSNIDDVESFRDAAYVDSLVYTLSAGIQSYLWDAKVVDVIPSILSSSSK